MVLNRREHQPRKQHIEAAELAGASRLGSAGSVACCVPAQANVRCGLACYTERVVRRSCRGSEQRPNAWRISRGPGLSCSLFAVHPSRLRSRSASRGTSPTERRRQNVTTGDTS